MKLIKSVGKKIVRRLVQPPWESDVMEFKQGIWQGVSPLFTDSGRQLGEENTRPFLFNDHIPAKTITCKYDGTRNGHLINMSALRIAMTNYDDAVEITKAVIRRHAAVASKNSSSAAGGIWDLYIIALASISLIAYSVRKEPSLNRSAVISDALASQYQFIAGIYMICRDMMDENSARIAKNDPISASELYEYADQHEIFTSFNGMVCAGSTKKIMDFLTLCTDEMKAAFEDRDGTSDDDSTSVLGEIVDDVDQWYRYALLSVEFECFLKAARRQNRIDTGNSTRIDDAETLGTYRKLSEYCVSFLPSGNVIADDTYESGSLARQNGILKTLNRKSITEISGRLLTEQLSYD